MADIKAEAPLARLENDDEFGEFGDFRSHEDVQNCNTIGNSYFAEVFDDNASIDGSGDSVFGDTISGSLEDLVSTFDEKITKCFSNFQENVENIAPVQVRSQEEIMEESQMWWTITGNFGNILPIDWSKSHARRLHMPTLNLQGHRSGQLNGGTVVTGQGNDRSGVEEEDAVASDLDMHALILAEDASVAAEPLKTADQIIQEIDDMMAESDASSCADLDSPDSAICEVRERPPLASRDKLETMSSAELNETLLDLESMVKDYSEVLIDELALRDELEYEKELKNQFISLLLTVQNKRRQSGSDRKKRKTGQTLEAKYLTTVIPYMANSGCPHNSTLQVLIKILRAIDEDTPTVPTLLTDYILKVLCPT